MIDDINDINGLLNDIFIIDFINSSLEDKRDEDNLDSSKEDNKFYRSYDDVDIELYPMCKSFKKLSVSLYLFRLKCLLLERTNIWYIVIIINWNFSWRNIFV